MSTANQNPLYPRDAALTPDQMAAMARATSMVRAQSPGELMCQIDNVSSDDVGYDHTHDYATCMAFREQHVIGDSDPWTFWELADVWAEQQPAQVPPPPGPPPPIGWNSVARINPGGISQMDNFGQASSTTFAVRIEPAQLVMAAGSQLRVTFCGQMIFSDVYIGRGGGLDSNGNANPWIQQEALHLTFGGQNQATIPRPTGFAAVDGFEGYDLASDPLPQPLDFSQGVIVSFYMAALGPPPSPFTNYVTRRMIEPGWTCRNAGGNLSNVLDKSGWGASGAEDIAVLMIESLYP
jgi:hypothetical protein